MARVINFVEHMVARFPAGTFSRIKALLLPGEDRTGFVRVAVVRELKRRERSARGERSAAAGLDRDANKGETR